MCILSKLSMLGMLTLPLSACGQSTVATNSSADTTAAFGAPIDRGVLDNAEIDEASGLVASRKNLGALWTHNDSGGDTKVYLLSDRGATQATYRLMGAKSRDWEDIAIGPGPVEDETYLYVGDIGDNNAHYSVKTVYRFVEPLASDSSSGTVV